MSTEIDIASQQANRQRKLSTLVQISNQQNPPVFESF